MGLNATADFLAAHANLQVLHLDLSFGADITLPPDVLPCLRELQSGCLFASALLHCPCSANGGRPLETLKGMVLDGGQWSNHFLDGLQSVGTSIKRIKLEGWSDMASMQRLAKCVPNLVWLDVGRRSGRISTAPEKLVNIHTHTLIRRTDAYLEHMDRPTRAAGRADGLSWRAPLP